MVPFTALSFPAPSLSPLSSSSSPPFLGANEASESQGSAVIQHSPRGDGGLSGITSHKGPPQTVVSSDNGVGEPLVGRSAPAQWPLESVGLFKVWVLFTRTRTPFSTEGKRREGFLNGGVLLK